MQKSEHTFFYSGIDWSQPWYAAVLAAAQRVLTQDSWRGALNAEAKQRGLTNHQGLPLCFITQEELPDGVAYEAHISATGNVPTRENLHDFFNSLVWLSFPLIKRQLNALQAAQIAALGIGKSRGPARDAATIFDENAAFLVIENSAQGRQLLEQLQQHQWQVALHDSAQLFGSKVQVWSFGHALMEKLVQPYKGITAHSWVVWVEPEYFNLSSEQQSVWIDRAVSAQLQHHNLSTNDYTPLPVLGVPTWCAGQDLAFYQDKSVFRDKRST